MYTPLSILNACQPLLFGIYDVKTCLLPASLQVFLFPKGIYFPIMPPSLNMYFLFKTHLQLLLPCLLFLSLSQSLPFQLHLHYHNHPLTLQLHHLHLCFLPPHHLLILNAFSHVLPISKTTFVLLFHLDRPQLHSLPCHLQVQPIPYSPSFLIIIFLSIIVLSLRPFLIKRIPLHILKL